MINSILLAIVFISMVSMVPTIRAQTTEAEITAEMTLKDCTDLGIKLRFDNTNHSTMPAQSLEDLNKYIVYCSGNK